MEEVGRSTLCVRLQLVDLTQSVFVSMQVLTSLPNLHTINFDDCLVRSEGLTAMAEAFSRACPKLKVIGFLSLQVYMVMVVIVSVLDV